MEKLKSILGDSSELKGDFYSGGILRLDGIVNGNVRAEEIIVSATASVEGEISAGKISVVGRVKGTLRADDLVEIHEKGYVNGTILTKRLAVLNGGIFNGRVEMK